MVEVLRTQDILGLSSTGYADPDDWLARDSDVECPIYLVVYPGPSHTDHAHERWSVAWPVSSAARGTAAWRHVQLEAYDDPLASEFSAQYAYFGAITKSVGPEIAAARGFALGPTRLVHRREVERLARETPVCAEEEGWTCQDWVRDLLARMAAAGVVSTRACEDAVAKASGGECALCCGCRSCDRISRRCYYSMKLTCYLALLSYPVLPISCIPYCTV